MRDIFNAAALLALTAGMAVGCGSDDGLSVGGEKPSGAVPDAAVTVTAGVAGLADTRAGHSASELP